MRLKLQGDDGESPSCSYFSVSNLLLLSDSNYQYVIHYSLVTPLSERCNIRRCRSLSDPWKTAHLLQTVSEGRRLVIFCISVVVCKLHEQTRTNNGVPRVFIKDVMCRPPLCRSAPLLSRSYRTTSVSRTVAL